MVEPPQKTRQDKFSPGILLTMMPGIGMRETMRTAIGFGQGFRQLRVATCQIHPAKSPGRHELGRGAAYPLLARGCKIPELAQGQYIIIQLENHPCEVCFGWCIRWIP